MILGFTYIEMYLMAGLVYALWGGFEIVSDPHWKEEYGGPEDWIGLAVFIVGATALWPALFLLDAAMYFLVSRK